MTQAESNAFRAGWLAASQYDWNVLSNNDARAAQHLERDLSDWLASNANTRTKADKP
jgi:hypothetical protein